MWIEEDPSKLGLGYTLHPMHSMHCTGSSSLEPQTTHMQRGHATSWYLPISFSLLFLLSHPDSPSLCIPPVPPSPPPACPGGPAQLTAMKYSPAPLAAGVWKCGGAGAYLLSWVEGELGVDGGVRAPGPLHLHRQHQLVVNSGAVGCL